MYARNSPAADAASGRAPEPGLKGDLVDIGLRLRAGKSVFFVFGERERRSNLEALFGSGSVWSNLDRFELRLSSSAILIESSSSPAINNFAR